MTPPPTTPTVPSTISADYARRVGKQFGRISATERDDLVNELAARLDAASPSSYADLVQRFGTPQEYAAEMTEAMGETPTTARRRRWILPTTALIIILVVGAAVAWSRKTDISGYPIGFGSSMVPEGGGIEAVGSTLLVHMDQTKIAEVSLDVRNDGTKTVRIQSFDPLLGVEATPDGGFAVSEGIPPIWSPAIRVFPQADQQGVVVLSFDDPSGSDFEPFDLAAGDHAVLSWRGPINYCITAQGSVGDRLRMHVTIDGRQRIVEGPEDGLQVRRLSVSR